MGLISGLLTLPLAPVRGTAWIAERVQEQAETELYDEDTIREQLLELEQMRERGEVPEEDIAAAEDELIALLMEIRGGHGSAL
jgi:hypothetical protein